MQIDLQPTLEGELVRLRPMDQDDWADMYAAASDPLIWEVHPARDRYTEPAFRQYFDEGLGSGGALTIIDRANGRIIGSSRYNGHNPALAEIEIGWTFLARPYWGGSYNREIKQLMLNHIYGFVETVIFVVGEDNIRSCRAMEKIGGVLRPGTQLRAYKGEQIRYVIYEIRKPWLPA
jgi:RimJ/RimL family protein N-acetyltransferase